MVSGEVRDGRRRIEWTEEGVIQIELTDGFSELEAEKDEKHDKIDGERDLVDAVKLVIDEMTDAIKFEVEHDGGFDGAKESTRYDVRWSCRGHSDRTHVRPLNWPLRHFICLRDRPHDGP